MFYPLKRISVLMQTRNRYRIPGWTPVASMVLPHSSHHNWIWPHHTTAGWVWAEAEEFTGLVVVYKILFLSPVWSLNPIIKSNVFATLAWHKLCVWNCGTVRDSEGGLSFKILKYSLETKTVSLSQLQQSSRNASGLICLMANELA